MRLTLALVLVWAAATPALAAEPAWGTSSDDVNMGDVFGRRWLATIADETGAYRLNYACDEIFGEAYLVIETPLPLPPVDLVTTAVKVTLGEASVDVVGYMRVHGNIPYAAATLGVYQDKQVDIFASVAKALKTGTSVQLTLLGQVAMFPAADAAPGIAYVEANCR